MPYDVTLLTVPPSTMPRALAGLKESLPKAAGTLLACWFTDIGALNQIMIIREFASEADIAKAREAEVLSENLFDIGELISHATSDTYASFPFVEAMKPGQFGPFFEARTYRMKPNGLAGTIEGWRKSLPARVEHSPVLAALYSVNGVTHRFLHIWPYKTLDERHQIRNKVIEMGIWPPPGGPQRLMTMQNDIYLPAAFSPIR